MSFPGALSAAQINKVRGTSVIAPTYQCAVNLSLVPNTNVYTARVNQASFTSPLAELTYDGGSGTLADVMAGMTILVSHTNDRAKAFWRGRVRKAPTASILYVNETSGARFDDDDYIFVLDDFAITDKLARDVAGTMYIDWDVAFRQLLPLVYDLKSSYADWVDGASVYTIAFAPTCVAAASGASIVSYLWDVGDGTITVGTSSTQNITVTFPPGFRYVHFTVTDSNDNSITRHIPVWAHHPDDYPVTLLTYGNLAINADVENGYTASLSAFDGVDTVLDQTLMCFWCDEMYNGTDEHIIDNILCVGRLRTESNSTSWDDTNQDDQVSYTVDGALPQLAKLRVSAIEALLDATPTGWTEIAAQTPWRVMHLILTEFSTFAELHSYEFDDIDTFAFPSIVTAGQDIKTSIMDLVESVNALLHESASGECKITRKAVYLTSAERTALATILNMTTADLLSIEDYSRDHFRAVGSVTAEGGGYNNVSGEVSAYVAVSPSGAPDPGSSEISLRRQILTANQSIADEQDELTERSGNALAEAQDTGVLTLLVLDGLRFLEPDASAWYTLTLGGTETTRGIVLTTSTRWVLTGKQLQFNHELGTVDVRLTLRQETTGDGGEIIIFPTVDVGEFPVNLGDLEDPIDIPSLAISDIDYDFVDAGDGGWISFYGSHTPGSGWESECVGGSEELIDIYVEFGEVRTLLSITAIYDANYAGGADGQNQFLCRLNTGEWVQLHTFTTQTGTDVTETQSWSNIQATAIRVIMYAGGSDCTGSLTLKQLTYQSYVSEGMYDFRIAIYTAIDPWWTGVNQNIARSDTYGVYGTGLLGGIWSNGVAWSVPVGTTHIMLHGFNIAGSIIGLECTDALMDVGDNAGEGQALPEAVDTWIPISTRFLHMWWFLDSNTPPDDTTLTWVKYKQ